MTNDTTPKFKVIGARLPLDLVAKLDEMAAAEQRTRSNMLQVLLERATQKPQTAKAN